MNPTFLRLLAALVFATLVAGCIQLPIIGKPTPIASRDIDLAGDCRRTEEDSGCKLMVWQDPRRVTLAHANCQQRCTPGIYEQAWPVMFEPGSGGCAATR
ncbi:hypothetical protein D9M70_431630 [compost metagenome]